MGSTEGVPIGGSGLRLANFEAGITEGKLGRAGMKEGSGGSAGGAAGAGISSPASPSSSAFISNGGCFGGRVGRGAGAGAKVGISQSTLFAPFVQQN